MADAKKILLVEDDTNLREIYGARLQAEGYEIVSAPDGENALAIAVKEKPDLIISDIMMPKVSGFDMLDILRNAPETKNTKIIMMTALSQAEDKARADKLGADMYLVKSQVTLEDVTKAVHQILDGPSESTQEADSAAGQQMVSGDQKQEKQDQAKPEEKSEDKQETEKPKTPPKEESPAPAPSPQEPPAQSNPQQPEQTAKEEDKPENNPQPQQPPQPEPQKSSEPVATPPPADKPADPSAASEPKPEAQAKPENNPSASGSPSAPAADAAQSAKPADNTAAGDNQASNATSIPVSSSDDDNAAGNSQTVEPNLAQALEDEEKAVQEKIEDFEKSGQKASDNAGSAAQPPGEQAVKEQPTAPQEQQQSADENSPEAKNEQAAAGSDDKQENPLDEKPSRKVIEPINDPTKGPDINELVAKEEAKEAGAGSGPDQTNPVVKPQTSGENDGQSSQDNQNSSDSKDDFGKISL